MGIARPACRAHTQAMSAGVMAQPRYLRKQRRGSKGGGAKQGRTKSGNKTAKPLRELAELVKT